jgi:hypothetical protein
MVVTLLCSVGTPTGTIVSVADAETKQQRYKYSSLTFFIFR